MFGGVKMLGRVLVGGIVEAADVAEGPADQQMEPLAGASQTFLATERARRHAENACDVGAALRQRLTLPLYRTGSYRRPRWQRSAHPSQRPCPRRCQSQPGWKRDCQSSALRSDGTAKVLRGSRPDPG